MGLWNLFGKSSTPVDSISDHSRNALAQSLTILIDELEDALVSCDICHEGTSESIIGYKSRIHLSQDFSILLESYNQLIKDSKLDKVKGVGEYHIIHLKNNSVILFLRIHPYQWIIRINMKISNLGILLNVLIPKIKSLTYT